MASLQLFSQITNKVMKFVVNMSTPSHSHTHQIKKQKNHSQQHSVVLASHSKPTPSNQSKTSNTSDHYQFHVGEQMGEYQLIRQLGQGTFGRVFLGEKKGRRYAIKVIRPVSKYIESAKIEKQILKNINRRDERDQEGIVRYKHSFYHYQHFCMVFQPLGLSLYQIIKKNEYRGFPLKTVQNFLRQIFKSIAFMHKLGYTHTDLKPENILIEKEDLIEEQRQGISYFLPKSNKIRVIDFGGATLFNQSHSSIICTRQYRPPEVILQCCQWNELADVWSIGCIAVELLTGDLLFPTHNDTQHLVMICKNSGRVPQWMVNKASSSRLRGLFREGAICESQAERQLEHWQNIEGMRTSEELLECESLRDLVKQCLQIDPNRRINCKQALRHRFFQERLES